MLGSGGRVVNAPKRPSKIFAVWVGFRRSPEKIIAEIFRVFAKIMPFTRQESPFFGIQSLGEL